MKILEILKALDDGLKIHNKNYPSNTYTHIVNGRQVSADGKVCSHDFYVTPGDWELYEESGHDWNWAKDQLRLGRHVKRKGNLDTYYLDKHGCIMMFGGPGEKDEPKYHWIDDDTATDWVLA